MSLPDIVPLLIALIPYVLVHAVIVSALLSLRRRLSPEHRLVSRWLLVATATPLFGPIVSSVALASLARCMQRATAALAVFRSDCGHAAGIAYGLFYFAAAWIQSPALGALSLALLVAYFWQMLSALRALRRTSGQYMPLPITP